MPVFAIFFPLDVAIASTAIVHFLNNLFKLYLLGRLADRPVVIRFGLPAIISALLGAWLLLRLSALDPLASYYISGHEFQVMPVKVVIAAVMVFFAVLEVAPKFENVSFDRKYLPIGGVLSGFFGGLSGHQGAMRSAFLIKCGLSKEQFIATGVVIACIVDISRLSIYAPHLLPKISGNTTLILTAALSAFLGTFIGKQLINKVTMRYIQLMVSVMLFGIAVGLGSGII